jgi:RPE4 domain-containing protein
MKLKIQEMYNMRTTGNRLLDAISLDSVEEVKEFIEAKIEINGMITAKFFEVTPLLYAISIGNKIMVQLLLEHRASLQVGLTCKPYPFLYACSRKNGEDMVSLLVEKKAEVNQVFDCHNNLKATPLGTAIRTNCPVIVRTLLELKANPALEVNPLMRAAKVGSKEIIRLLLTAGVNVNETATVDDYDYTSRYGKDKLYTPLQILLSNPVSDFSGSEAGSAQLLLEFKADMSFRHPVVYQIFLLVYHNDVKFFRQQANLETINYQKDDGPTPLYLAVSHGNKYTTMVKTLLELKADPNLCFKDASILKNSSPLEGAIKGECIEFIDESCRENLIFSKKGAFNCFSKNVAFVNCFYEEKVSPEMAFLLLDAKADVYHRSFEGFGLWEMALQHKQIFLLAALMGHYLQLIQSGLKDRNYLAFSNLGTSFRTHLQQRFEEVIRTRNEIEPTKLIAEMLIDKHDVAQVMLEAVSKNRLEIFRCFTKYICSIAYLELFIVKTGITIILEYLLSPLPAESRIHDDTEKETKSTHKLTDEDELTNALFESMNIDDGEVLFSLVKNMYGFFGPRASQEDSAIVSTMVMSSRDLIAGSSGGKFTLDTAVKPGDDVLLPLSKTYTSPF